MKIAEAGQEFTHRARAAGFRRRFVRDASGAAATEMAMIAPICLALLGVLTLGRQGFELQGKVALAAHTVTDLVAQTPYQKDPAVAQATELNQSDLDTDLALSSEIMYPNPSTTLTAVVSELLVNSTNSTGVVVWSEGYNGGAPLAVGTPVPLGSAIMAVGGSYLIYAQVQYSFTPLGITQTVGQITLSDSEMLVPRNAAQITINWGQ